MNNKGFTFVELLLTIVILGLIVCIAISSYSGIAIAIRNSQRNNVIKNIENAASKYAFDSGETLIFVDKLITEGYINGDNENGDLNDPVNNKKLNCYVVKMEKSGNYYNAKFIDGKHYEKNDECDITALNMNDSDITILLNGSNYSGNDNWIKGEAILKAHTNNSLVIDCTNNRCSWSSISGASSIGTDTVVINNLNGILNTKYIFQYTIFDDNSSEVKRYSSSINLKIDNNAPVINLNDTTISDRYIYTETKTVEISASDGKGSGIEGYYFGKNVSNCNSTSIIDNYQNSNLFTINENGTYLICVKDKVGNIVSSNIDINYIT